MASAYAIISQIEEIVEGAGAGYSAWTVGVTDDPARRRAEHRNPRTWTEWNPASESDARKIELHFIGRGMKGGEGGRGSASHLYIF